MISSLIKPLQPPSTSRHIFLSWLIAPPLVVIDSYYWTEEVLIDGEYYILYCYPDGTKRFADGTIFCYF